MIILLIFLLITGSVLADQAAISQQGFSDFRTKDSKVRVYENQLLFDTIAFSEASTGDLLWEDFELTFQVEVRELGSEHAGFTLSFRSLGGRDCYALTVSPTAIYIRRYHGVYDKSVALGGYYKGLKEGDLAQFTIKGEKNRFTVYLDGTKIIEAIDSQNMYPYGYISVRSELARLSFKDWQLRASHLTDGDLKKRAQQGFGPRIEFESGEMLKALPGEPQDIMLIYDQYTSKNWMTVDALPYVTYLSETYQPQDWFFDSFLFLALTAPGGRNFGAAPAAIMDDYLWWLDRMFASDKNGLGAFERAVEMNLDTLPKPDHPLNIIMMIPHPDESAGTPFGLLNGDKPVLTGNPQEASRGRFEVVKWWVDEVITRFEKNNYQNLRLVGFYWLAEELDLTGIDKLYLPEVGDLVRSKGMKFYWIPWYMSPGFENWQDLGFDAAIMQPNYMFDTDISKTRLEKTASLAQKYNLGLEFEADKTVFTSEGKERYLDYYRAANSYGYVTGVLKAFYQETDILARAALSQFPMDREIYDLTYDFINGNFNEKLFAE